MGRVYDEIKVDGKGLYTIFDPGATRSYVTKESAEKANLRIEVLKEIFQTGLGGDRLTIKEYCVIEGRIYGNPFYITANIIPTLGISEKGNKIDVLFGALDMQMWNIQLDLEKEKLDLSRFRKEFIEYLEKI